MSDKSYPYNLLEDCGINTENQILPEDIEGTIYYLLYARTKKVLSKRNADIVIAYYQGKPQTEIAHEFGITRQRVLAVLNQTIQYLSKPENKELLVNGIREYAEGSRK